MSNRPIRLYDYLFSGNGYKIRLALSQLNISVEYEFLDLLTGETKDESFLEKNPMGQIPVLEFSDGLLLRESNAILCHISENTRLMPKEAAKRSQLLQWMFFEQSNVNQVIGRARFLRTFPDFVKMPKGYIESLIYLGNNALSVLEMGLLGSSFILGDSYSAADISLFAYVHSAEEGGFDLDEYPTIGSWIQRVKEQDGYIPIDFQPT